MNTPWPVYGYPGRVREAGGGEGEGEGEREGGMGKSITFMTAGYVCVCVCGRWGRHASRQPQRERDRGKTGKSLLVTHAQPPPLPEVPGKKKIPGSC